MSTVGDEEQLAINVIAKLTDLEKQMAKANGITARAFREMTLTTKRATRQMEDDAARSASRINQAMATVGTRIGGVGRAFAAAAVAAFSTEKLIEASQAYVRASNALKVAGLSGGQLADTFGRLYAIAQANGAPIETLVALYSKASQAQASLGASNGQLIQFTTAVAQALRVSGQSAEEASGALLQLGQAVSMGTIHAEEYNSMLEGAYPLLQAAAAGIKEAGGEVSKLTTLVKAGEVSSKAFFYGVLAGAPLLTEKLAGSTETLSQAWTKFENALIKSVGEIDQVTGATASLSTGLGSLVPWLEKIPAAMDLASSKWAGFKAAVNEAAAALNHFMGIDTKEAAKAAGLTPIDEARDAAAKESIRNQMKAQYSTGGGFGTDGDAAKRVADAFTLFDKPKIPINPVSLKDYPAEGKKKDGEGGSEANPYESAADTTRKRIAMLEAETASIGKNTFEREKAKAVAELTQAAYRADLPLTNDLRGSIDQLAGSYATAAARAEQMQKAHEDVIGSADRMRSALSSATTGFISDLRNGKTAAEALGNALDRLADRMIDRLVDQAFTGLLGKAGTTLGGAAGSSGFFGWLSSLFADGGAFGPGGVRAFAGGGAFTNRVVDNPTLFRFAGGTGLMGEAGPEAIMPLQRDRNGRLGVAGVGAAATAVTNHFAPNVTVQSIGTGDAGADKRAAAETATQVRAVIEKVANEWFVKNSRPGGAIARREISA
jgi:lambda family phage tail tape measure protein